VIRDENGFIDGWLMTFLREGKRNFALLVSDAKQGRGIGTALVKEMQKNETDVLGWIILSNDYVKTDGSVYFSPADFYKKSGFFKRMKHRMSREYQ
jgi:GNAT superfamily N-acetyltransferase